MPSSGVPLLKTVREKPLNTPPCGQNYNFICFRVLASIVILGKACDLIDQHQEQKKASTASMSSSPQKHQNTTEMSSTSPEAAAVPLLNSVPQPQPRPAAAAASAASPPEKVKEKDLSSPPRPLRQPGSQVTSAEDISLLEAKLQRIDATRAFPTSPSAPVLAEV